MTRGKILVVSALLAGGVAIVTARAAQRAGRLEKVTLRPAWSVALPGVTAMVYATLRPGEPQRFVFQGPGFVALAGIDGAVLARRDFPASAMTAATADVTGDGADEVLVAHRSGAGNLVEAFDAHLTPLWSAALPARFGSPARVVGADLDGDRRRDVLVGDEGGRVAALSAAGAPLWTFEFPPPSGQEGDAIRGIDDQRTGKQRRVVVARRSGEVAILDARGRVLWRERVAAGIRRLRTLDLDGDGDDEILAGSDGNGLMSLVKPDEASLFTATGGWAVTEARRIEWDGDPRTTEVAVGSRDGQVCVLAGPDGRAVYTARLGQRISDVAGADTNGDGRDELVAGDEGGGVHLFGASGPPISHRGTGKVDRILTVLSPLRDRLIVVAGGPAVTAYRKVRATAPSWYHPLAAGVAGGVLLVIVAATLLSLGPPRAPAPSAARLDALDDAVARIEGLVAQGVVTRDAVEERLRQIEKQRAAAAEAPPARVAASPPPPPRRA